VRVGKKEKTSYGQPVIHVYFSANLPSAVSTEHFTQNRWAGRVVNIQPQARYEALQAGRKRNSNKRLLARVPAWAGVRRDDRSRRAGEWDALLTRYLGLWLKTRLQHILTAVALNLLRLVAWFEERPLAERASRGLRH